jgi:signal transduction histidine kinase
MILILVLLLGIWFVLYCWVNLFDVVDIEDWRCMNWFERFFYIALPIITLMFILLLILQLIKLF